MKVHKSVTAKRVMRLARESMFGDSYHGICLACGKSAHGVEPDARQYKCEACGEMKVYGAEEVVLMIA